MIDNMLNEFINCLYIIIIVAIIILYLNNSKLYTNTIRCILKRRTARNKANERF